MWWRCRAKQRKLETHLKDSSSSESRKSPIAPEKAGDLSEPTAGEEGMDPDERPDAEPRGPPPGTASGPEVEEPCFGERWAWICTRYT